MSSGELIKIPGKGDLIGGQFLLGEELGRGGFGIVFKARQLGVERPVAVKMLMPHAMTHEGVVERFKREARLADSLTHPNSVTIYAYGVHKPEDNIRGLPYIAMEYLIGRTLHQFLRGRDALSFEEAIPIVAQTLGSLAEAHKKGIIHRDIKPENIFIVEREGEERVIKVLDFGIAKAVAGDWDPETRERLTRTGLIAGTAEYMAPEQATGAQDITPALDIYAMGCITYQLVTGDVPYTGNSPMEIAIKHISEPIPILPDELASHFLGRVIRKAMAKEPIDRFQDAQEMEAILESGHFEDEEIIRAPPISILSRPPADMQTPVEPADYDVVPPQGPPVWLIGAVIALLVVAIGLLLVLILGGDDPETSTITPPVLANNVEDGDKDDAAEVKANDAFKMEDAVEAKADDGKDPTLDAEAEAPTAAQMPEAITLETAPVVAAVFKGEQKLGTTPLILQRAEHGDETFEVELRAKGFENASVSVNWTSTPESGSILEELVRSSNRTRAKDRLAHKSKANGGGSDAVDKAKADEKAKAVAKAKAKARARSRGKDKNTTPKLFDIGSKTNNKKKDDSKKQGSSPSLFKP